jgi:4-hydroxy-3-polyprenylbenzoate decarboxylase
MAFSNLSDFIKLLKERRVLVEVEEEVDPNLEITAIVEKVLEKRGPALLFKRVKGSDIPLVINLFGTDERMGMALGKKPAEIGEEIESWLKPVSPKGFLDKLRLIPKIAELSSFFPKIVKSAPCQEIIEEPNLYKFPHLKCWPKDAGRFITLGLVFTKSLSGDQNCGIYRMQVFDKETCGMHWHPGKGGALCYKEYKRAGKRMDVAVALGGPPEAIYAASAPLPQGFDEMIFAGFLRKRPIEMVNCKTVDIQVPAQAEIVLEGYIEGEREEGPFGDHTGYYSAPAEFPVFHLTLITHRKSPIYPATIVGRPPKEDVFLAKATERIFLPFIKAIIPEIVDINLPEEGAFHNCCIVSIKKSYPGQAKKVASAIWGLGQLSLTKVLIIVEEDVNVHNISEVSWKCFSNIDPKRDFLFTEGSVDILDHASPYFGYGSKVAIDATKKTEEEGMCREWPEEIKMYSGIEEMVEERWSDYRIEL